MSLLNFSEASKIEFAPTRQYLSKVAKKWPPPLYMWPVGDRFYVDTDSPAWFMLLYKRQFKAMKETILQEILGEYEK